jgi:transcription factor TGA
MFDIEYGRWVEEHNKLMFQLRAALNEPQLLTEDQLQGFVNGAMAKHEELLNLKGAIARLTSSTSCLECGLALLSVVSYG